MTWKGCVHQCSIWTTSVRTLQHPPKGNVPQPRAYVTVASAIFCNHTGRVKEDENPILDSFADKKLDAEAFHVISRTRSKLFSETFLALYDNILGGVWLKAPAPALPAESCVISKWTLATVRITMQRRGLEWTATHFSKRIHMETLQRPPFQGMARRREAINVLVALIASLIDPWEIFFEDFVASCRREESAHWSLRQNPSRDQRKAYLQHFWPENIHFLNGKEEQKLYECIGCCDFGLCLHSERQKLAVISNLDAINLASFSAFFAHVYMQHLGAGYIVHTSVRIYVFFFNDITFSYARFEYPNDSFCRNCVL